MDEMDVILRRSLKNWAATERPPVEAREQLFQKILEENNPPAVSYPNALSHPFLQRLFRRPVPNVNQDDGLLGPFTQSRAWSFHVTSAMRLVA